MNKITRTILGAAVIALGLSGAAGVAAASQASPAKAPATVTCGSVALDFSNVNGYSWFDIGNTGWILVNGGSGPTRYYVCNQYGGNLTFNTPFELKQAGTDRCATYSGNRGADNGVLTEITCAPLNQKASQTFNYLTTNNEVINGYTGPGLCLAGYVTGGLWGFDNCANNKAHNIIFNP